MGRGFDPHPIRSLVGSSYPLREAGKVEIVPMPVVNRTELEKRFETT